MADITITIRDNGIGPNGRPLVECTLDGDLTPDEGAEPSAAQSVAMRMVGHVYGAAAASTVMVGDEVVAQHAHDGDTPPATPDGRQWIGGMHAERVGRVECPTCGADKLAACEPVA